MLARMVTKDKFGKTGRAIKMCQSKMLTERLLHELFYQIEQGEHIMCIYNTHELTKFTKIYKKSHMFFRHYFIYV
jgi:hypothetical protein